MTTNSAGVHVNAGLDVMLWAMLKRLLRFVQACVSPMDQKEKGYAVSFYDSMVFNVFSSFNSILFATYCPNIVTFCSTD